ncbi:MAG: acetyl ornithine aminotransferase family protein [Thermoprotei archaeon]
MSEGPINKPHDLPKIVVTPPGPNAQKIIERDSKVISRSYVRFYPLVVKEVKENVVVDVDGNEYIDFNSGLVVLNVGRPKEVVEAIKRQADRFLHYSLTDFYYEEAVTLAEKLTEIVPVNGKEKMVHFSNSGAEAIEAAMKLARYKTGRPYLFSFIGSFHGRTYGAMSLTASKPVQRKGFSPLVPATVQVPYPYCYRCPFHLQYPECNMYCIDYIEEWVLSKYVPPEEVAGIVVEPVQGEGGYVWPPQRYFEKLKKLAEKYGILFIDDEIQAGFGRTGKWFAIEHWDVKPDIIILAKAIASGLPLGAMIASKDIMTWEKGSHASTFGGNPVSCAASLATIEYIEKNNLLENVRNVGDYIFKRFKEIEENSRIVGDVRGKGFMIGVEIVKDKNTKEPGIKEAENIILQSWKQGVALITAGKSTLRIAPPLTMTKELAEKAIEIIERNIKITEKTL